MKSKGNDFDPMSDRPASPSPMKTGGSFGGHTPKEFSKAPSSYGVIKPTQYADGVGGPGKGEPIESSPMNQTITPNSRPKGS